MAHDDVQVWKGRCVVATSVDIHAKKLVPCFKCRSPVGRARSFHDPCSGARPCANQKLARSGTQPRRAELLLLARLPVFFAGIVSLFQPTACLLAVAWCRALTSDVGVKIPTGARGC